MPSYQKGQSNRNVPQATPGLPVYLLGSFSYTTAATRMVITNLSLTSNVAILTVNVTEGNAPVVNQVVTITNANPSYLNGQYTISAVNQNTTPDTGVWTITIAVTHANVTSSPAQGLALAPVLEVGETIAAIDSLQCALQSNTGPDNARSIRADVSIGSGISAVQVDIYSAVLDLDSEYQILGTVLLTATSTPTYGSIILTGIVANFVRFHVSGLVGSGTIIGKVTV